MDTEQTVAKVKVNNYVADFETTTNPDNCHVWAFAICQVDQPDNIIIGTSIDEFMAWCENAKNPTIYFHNLKFDSQFIMSWLFKNNYTYYIDKKDAKTKSFNAVITEQGLYYELDVVFNKEKKHINRVKFLDSLKLIPLSVEQIAKAFKMDISKLEIDYDAHNNLPIGSPLSDIEKEYIKHDVQIVARAIAYFHSQGLNRMTIGACALAEYKKIIGKKYFNRYFPKPKFHDDVRQSYRGGYTYVNPKIAGKLIGKGIVLDYNSLYPSVMRYYPLPYGVPIYFKGQYKEDVLYPLYTQMIRCVFEIKKGMLPTIQIKHSLSFRGNEYLTTSNNEEIGLCLNSVDLKLFLEHYNVYNLEYISGWKFKSTQGLFDEYIDKWSHNKIQAKKEGNHGLYLISKLFL